MSTDGTDTISSGDGPERLPRRVRRPAAPTPGARTTALTAALSLVLAGGVATAAYRSSTDAVDPTSLMPASAFAVATVDLSAPGGALGDFADHFPGSPTHSGDGSAVEKLLRGMLRDSEDPHVDYDKDVAPWLGDHLAVAAWLGDDDQPRVEWLLESTDDGSAREHLRPLLSDGQGLSFESGYAVIADSKDNVTFALAAAKRAALADDATYTADVAALPSDEAAVGWLDGAGAKKALASAMGGFASPEDMFGQMPFSAMTGNPFEQRVALGVHVTGDYVQADMRTYGAPATTASMPASAVTELPSGTIGTAAFSGVDKIVDTMFGFLRDFAGISGSQSFCVSPAVPTRSPDFEIPEGTPHRRLIMKAQRRALKRYQRQVQRQGSTGAESFGCTTSEPADPIDEIERTTGLSLPGDVKTLLGDRLIVTFGGINLNGPPDVAIRTHPSDVDTARPIAEKLAAALAASSDFGVFVESPDDELVVATTPAYAKLVATRGTLGDDDAFAAAMGDVPDAISSAVFVDMTRIWPLIETQGEDVGDAKHLHAFGMWTAVEGDVQVAQMRLTAG